MRIVALLSWYDENPAWLGGLTAAFAGVADHIVAVDGAYSLYPSGRPRSPQGQAEAIRDAAAAINIGCTIHEPQTTWVGNEVEKRNFMFHLAEKITTPDDWYLVIDGDEIVRRAGDLKAEMEASPHHAADATLYGERGHIHPSDRAFVTGKREEMQIPVMFRALRGLSVVRKHYCYEAPDPEDAHNHDGSLKHPAERDVLKLWGDGPCEPRATFAVHIEHRQSERDLWRAKGATDYYDLRDRLGVENLT